VPINLILITGGSRGIGRALVEHYKAAGWTVVEFSRSGSGKHHVAIDLSDVKSAISTAARKFESLALKQWDRVVLVNNAGLLAPVAPVRLLDEAAIRRNLDVNLGSAIGLIAAFARCFSKSNANKIVVNISSGAALKGYFGWSLYCASKAGMENFIRSLAAEQSAELNPLVCINLAPGMVDTAMQAELRGTAPENFPDVGRFIQTKEAGELRTPEAVARAIARIVDEGPKNGERYMVADYD
jgi:NAD(P)-dependent dehydrogenase (short-subunit alcohol dehydrogenase family)